MANTSKNIIVSPNRGSDVAEPNILLVSGGNTSNIILNITDNQNGTMNIVGANGLIMQMSANGDPTFMVKDGSGGGLFEAYSNGEIYLNRNSGNTTIVSGILSIPELKLDNKIVTNSSQTFQEAGALHNVFVTPAVQHFHPSAAKFWVKCGVSADVQSSYNVTSVTDVGPGQLVINITNGFSSTNWVCLSIAYGAPSRIITANSSQAQATNSIKLSCASAGTTYADPVNWFAAGFGDR